MNAPPTEDPSQIACQRAYGITLALVPVLLALHFVPADDGLRHVALAFAGGRPWGEVYPFSQFARFADYDPWWGYDVALRALGAVLSVAPLDRLARQFLALKLLSAALLGTASWLLVRRARISTAITDARGLLLAVAITAIVLAEPLQRFSSARPFVIGTLWLLYAVGRTGAARGFVSAAILTGLYPYLAWVYVLAGAAAHLWRGSRGFALGALAAALAGAAFQPAALAGLVAALARSGSVRAELASAFGIRELSPLWQHPAPVVLVALAALWLVPRLDRDARRLRVEHVMALCFVPVSLVLARYLVDVVLPLLFVAHGADAVRVAQASFARGAARSTEHGDPSAHAATNSPLKSSTARAVSVSTPRERVVRALLALVLGVTLGALGVRAVAQHRDLARLERTLAAVPRASLVLTQFNLQYRILYVRPDLSLVPSSELGFPREDIRDAYVEYVRAGRVCTLARAIGAAFLVDAPSHRLDPSDTGCLTRLQAPAPLRVWRVASDGAR